MWRELNRSTGMRRVLVGDAEGGQLLDSNVEGTQWLDGEAEGNQ